MAAALGVALSACISPDSSGLERFSTLPYDPVLKNASPWSPDGSAILATSVLAGGLWRLDANGGAPVRLAAGSIENAAYSPDGEAIVYASWGDAGFVEGGEFSLWTMSSDGSTPTRIAFTRTPVLFRPVWSPDGSWIAYQIDDRIEIVRPDLSERRSLGRGLLSAWSPDASRIAFTDLDADELQWVAIRSLDGSPAVRVARGFLPSWSPDGRRLTFQYVAGEAPAPPEIRVVDLEGGEPRTIAYGLMPRWSPDGTRILALGSDGPDTDLFTVEPDGGRERVLARSVDYACWSPDGGRIAIGRGDEWLVVDAQGLSERSLGRPSQWRP